ncbi:FecCD family ABC transporter permease [Streptomonospora nanhaiensis]|uniref:Iron complex transport system permease protein n=1 Tax=Streptomonospora nanhaiensis TaxID=1323731 RepID=A0A853BWT8_9ACTN|nr:iron ABC transporter permease [Streptomonospora nanhaiensis]MBV2365566.1 iron ABC transporter permease [Streptomonospora nanhaiensis]MBX9387120.1 iron ABC transporter permease [Streptomonospora nanhaiensis]NYI98941.1 iron complex transport system permease protein [Streptomonospora nanhaiensis]
MADTADTPAAPRAPGGTPAAPAPPGPPPGRSRPAAVPTRRGRLPLPVALALLLAALPLAMTLGVGAGSVGISAADTWRILLHQAAPGLVPPDWPPATEAIVVTARLPRVLLAALVGAGLAGVGLVLQTLVRNPLADPLLLGVSSGATFGAVVVVVFGVRLFGGQSLPATAFLGALAALVAVYLLARTGGRISTLRLILSGVVMAEVLSAAAALVIMTSGDPHAAALVQRWTLGGLGGTTWATLPAPAAAVAVSTLVVAAQTPALNVFALGEETATGIGLNVGGFRAAMFVVVSLATGVLVAVSGPVGFVGLMMPHIARMLVGPDHRRALPVAVLLGAPFMVLADLVARTLARPEEIPVGILTALCGAPFFLWLMRRGTRRGAAG